MAVGDWHTLGSVTFKETLHGPMVWGVCHDCGGPTLVVGSGLKEDEFSKDPRCGTCWRTYHGLETERGKS